MSLNWCFVSLNFYLSFENSNFYTKIFYR